MIKPFSMPIAAELRRAARHPPSPGKVRSAGRSGLEVDGDNAPSDKRLAE